jgi:hypothetical protein
VSEATVLTDEQAEVRSAEVGRRSACKATWRLLPLIGLGYGIAYMDRQHQLRGVAQNAIFSSATRCMGSVAAFSSSVTRCAKCRQHDADALARR